MPKELTGSGLSPILIGVLRFAIVALVLPTIAGCSKIEWREEVKFLDGRVITVIQKRRVEVDNIPREAWVSFKLPEYGDKEIVWHEHLEAQVLNLHKGKLYVVGYPYTCIEIHKYGDPKPTYIGFRYDNGIWTRIPFREIPEAIYETNMYFENMAVYRLSRVSLAHKDAMRKEEGYSAHLKKVDPNYVAIAGC